MSRSIIKKTVGIGTSTLLSRFFAYIREVLLIQFLGIGEISDAFFIAFRVPNSLRKVFAEGALSSVLVPALIRAEQHDGHDGMNRLLTLSFVLIEAIVGLIILGIYCFADYIVFTMAPGSSALKLQASVQFLEVLAPFILFLSSSALLAAALQATHRFFLPGFASAMLNIFYVGFLSLAIYFSWSVTTFCWTMLIATALNFLIHVFVCIHYNFKIASPDEFTWKGFKHVIFALLPCLLSVGIGEINFWIDSAFASYLQSGTLSLLRYAYQFINIPLGVIVTSLSMVLLPYFATIGHCKKELGIYLAEAIKFVTWTMLPMTIVMMTCSREIFETMFFSGKFTMDNVIQAQWNMNAYLIGLIFFALEKILLNGFYALKPHEVVYDDVKSNREFCSLLSELQKTKQENFIGTIKKCYTILIIVAKSKLHNLKLFFKTVPPVSFATIVATVTIALNFFMNRWLMSLYGGTGLALATSLSAAVRIAMFIVILAYYFKIDFQFSQLWKLLRNYSLQLSILGSLFVGSVIVIIRLIERMSYCWKLNFWFVHFVFDAHFFLHSFGYWIWFGPLAGIFFLAIYRTRKFFGISFSYLD